MKIWLYAMPFFVLGWLLLMLSLAGPALVAICIGSGVLSIYYRGGGGQNSRRRGGGGW